MHSVHDCVGPPLVLLYSITHDCVGPPLVSLYSITHDCVGPPLVLLYSITHGDGGSKDTQNFLCVLHGQVLCS